MRLFDLRGCWNCCFRFTLLWVYLSVPGYLGVVGFILLSGFVFNGLAASCMRGNLFS